MDLNALREQRITADLERTRLRPGDNARDDRIIASIGSAHGDASVFLVLGHTPGQFEDVLSILVDDAAIATVEIDRSNVISSATMYEAETYKRDLSGVAAITFEVARKYARQLLARKS